MKLAYGRAMPLRKMLDMNITVSLATDGPTSNNNLDLFDDMKTSALMHKFEMNNPIGVKDQEIFDMFPITEITPDELVNSKYEESKTPMYKVVFKEKDLSEPLDSTKEFVLQDYYDNPELFKSKFEQYIPHLTILMNCMYWDDKYPRIVTKDYLEDLFKEGNPKLLVIGDVTCDPDGSIECTHKGTEIEDPVFVYNPLTRNYPYLPCAIPQCPIVGNTEWQ
jgi:hypothetical protein